MSEDAVSKITIKSAEWFVNTIMRHMVGEANSERRVWILGAGASADSGIPMAWQLASRWARGVFGLEPEGDEEEFHKRLEEKGWDKEHLDRHYFEIYDEFFASSQSGYQALLKEIEGKTPSYGYFILAHILSTTKSNLAITVNFDNLIANAIYLAGKGYPLILDHEGVAHLASPMTNVPMVCKIHRDLTKGPMSRSDEMERLKEQWKPALNEIFKYYSPIFIGYGGNDHTLMRYLTEYEGLISAPVWLIHTKSGDVKDEELSNLLPDDCSSFLRKNGGYVVPFSSFDLLFHLVAQKHMSGIDVYTEFNDRTREIEKGLRERIEELGKKLKDSPEDDPLAEAVREEEPKNAFGWFMKALGAEDINDQIMFYDKAITLDPNDPDSFINRGNAKAKLKRSEEALQDYDQAVILNPNDSIAFFNRGNAKSDLKRFEEAIKDYDRAVAIDSKDTDSLINRGIAKANLKRFEEAIQDYDKAVALDPKDPDAFINRANAKADLKRFEEAIKDYDRAVAIDSKDPEAFINRGIVKSELKRFEEAIQDYDRAVALDPRNVVAFDKRGAAHYKLGSYAEAITDYDQAISLDPQNASAFMGRGVSKAKLEWYDEAEQDFDKSFALDPGSSGVAYNKACLYALQRRSDEALEHLRSAIRLNSQNCGKARSDKDFDNMRDDPRFVALLEEFCPDKNA